jgi:hypothetical protein
MPKNYQPEKFFYWQSEILNQEIAMSKDSAWVYCEDKGPDGNFISYSPEEIQIMDAAGGTITPAIHTVKKVFGGRIVKYDKPEPDTKGEPDAGKDFDSTANNSAPGGKVPETAGISPVVRPGELDIY